MTTRINALFRHTTAPLIAVFMLSSCMTTGTAKLVKTTPMTEDLEAKVMRQTGISGAVIGAVVGTGAGIAVAALRISLAERQLGRNLTDNERKQIIAQTVTPMMVAGGVFGYKKGQQTGRNVTATAKDRDNMANLVQGARNYNSHLAQYNQELRNQASFAKAAGDSKRAAALRKEASAELKAATQRLNQRENAIQQIHPDYRASYAKTLPELKREKEKLEVAVRDLAATEASIHL